MISLRRLSTLAACVFSLAACETTSPPVGGLLSTRYHLIRVTNPRGELVADWVSEGLVERTQAGFRFRAVERVTAPPESLLLKYPLGRRVEVTGPNIFVAPCGQPLWLYELRDQQQPALAEK